MSKKVLATLATALEEVAAPTAMHMVVEARLESTISSMNQTRHEAHPERSPIIQ